MTGESLRGVKATDVFNVLVRQLQFLWQVDCRECEQLLILADGEPGRRFISSFFPSYSFVVFYRFRFSFSTRTAAVLGGRFSCSPVSQVRFRPDKQGRRQRREDPLDRVLRHHRWAVSD